MTQSDKARSFKSLHLKGTPLVLYNIWDAGSAKTVASAGAKAIATGSWSVAAAQGYPDGQAIPMEFALQIVQRITQAVDVPVTVDFEGGYTTDPVDLTVHVEKLIAAGAIGLNLEDQVVGGVGLHSIADQTARLRAVRSAALNSGIQVFLNARTDLFLKANAADHAMLMDETLARAAAYANAGSDGFFVPGLTDLTLIRQLAAKITLPLNAMMVGELTSEALASAGVARISYGPGPYRRAQEDLSRRCGLLS